MNMQIPVMDGYEAVSDLLHELGSLHHQASLQVRELQDRWK